MDEKQKLYLVGLLASFAVGFSIYVDYGFSLGVVTWYALGVLVDIRKEVTK